ncbi:MAG: hypothetical protein KDD98_12265 [Sphingomonadaceae bacterium]|nr:hypothetical protein [Sphingomonadaceae bacterium]
MAGTYVLERSFEAAMQLELRADGTYLYALSVGALDERSQGSWSVTPGGTITFATTPRPEAPEFERLADGTVQDSPYLIVIWPNGVPVQGINVALQCANGATAYGYTLDTGWPYEGPEEDMGGDDLCDDPQSLRLIEPVHDVYSPAYDVAGAGGGLRFVLHPNDMGVRDMTDWQASVTGNRIRLLHESEGAAVLVRLPR